MVRSSVKIIVRFSKFFLGALKVLDNSDEKILGKKLKKKKKQYELFDRTRTLSAVLESTRENDFAQISRRRAVSAGSDEKGRKPVSPHVVSNIIFYSLFRRGAEGIFFVVFLYFLPYDNPTTIVSAA